MSKSKLILSCFTFFYLTLSSANEMTQQQLKMIEQLDQLERLDHMEFMELNTQANTCIWSNDFSCAEKKIAEAKKLASSSSERNLLQNTRQTLQNERQRIADEERLRAQEEQRLADAEEEMQRARQRARDDEDEQGPSTAEQIQQFGDLFLQQYANNLADKRAAQQYTYETTRKRNADYEAANNRLQESYAERKAQIEADRNVRNQLEQQRRAQKMQEQERFRQQQAVVTNSQTSINEVSGGYNNSKINMAQGEIPVLDAQASRSGDTLWHDDYSNTVTKTGETKSYPNHERNIPGSYIVKVKDRASAEAVWSNQGGKVIDYYGSIDSGKITVIVDFGYIKDTHVYVRDK